MWLTEESSVLNLFSTRALTSCFSIQPIHNQTVVETRVAVVISPALGYQAITESTQNTLPVTYVQH